MGRKTGTKVPELRSLPPSRETFKENVKRANIPTAICKSALEYEPSALDPAEYGWERDKCVRCMVLLTLPPNVSVAPSEVLEMIKCGCTTRRTRPVQQQCVNAIKLTFHDQCFVVVT
jgi:hypothetical protein